LIKHHSGDIPATEIGASVKNLPIIKLEFGSGKTRVMMWSQMHGNESTTTKALFDLINYILAHKNDFKDLSFLIIPVLNPDGAKAYTRFNGNNIDLNRDAQDKGEPETRALFHAFNDFKPHYCFNLHGQRTIFGVGDTDIPATLSFLAPAQDQQRSISPNRRQSMAIIGGVIRGLRSELKGGIGLYDDAFNINCTGDTFQSLGIPTILFEAGHFPNDYERETTRFFVFKALKLALDQILKGVELDILEYENTPFNKKSFLDVIIRNTRTSEGEIMDVGIQFKEVLVNDRIDFIPVVDQLGSLDHLFAHREINAGYNELNWPLNRTPEVGDEIVFVLLKNEKILIKV
jgi:hypothetical protein